MVRRLANLNSNWCLNWIGKRPCENSEDGCTANGDHDSSNGRYESEDQQSTGCRLKFIDLAPLSESTRGVSFRRVGRFERESQSDQENTVEPR